MSAERARAGSGTGDVLVGQTMAIEGIALSVRVSGRRNRIGLTVERDGSLTLRAPEGCRATRARDFVHASRAWIDDKLRLAEQHRQLHPVRLLRDGEIHRYLGRDYRLLLVEDEEGVDGAESTAEHGAGPDWWESAAGQQLKTGKAAAPVRLKAGRMRISRSLAAEPRRGQKAIAAWYCAAGQRWARGRLQPWAARMDVSEPAVDVRDLGSGWGAYSVGAGGAGRIALHWAVFQLPPHLIDYMTAHELAHGRVAGHGADYWRLLSRALPECRRLKAELDDLGRRVWMGDVSE